MFNPYRTVNTVSKEIMLFVLRKYINAPHKWSVDFKTLVQNCENLLLVLSCMSFRPSVCLSICPSSWNNWAPIGRIFMKFDI